MAETLEHQSGAATRRGFLGAAALASGGTGLLLLNDPEPALASEHLFQGFNNVKTTPPGYAPGTPGATGDGVTDDQAKIQAWITASGENGTNPGTVYFPPGQYLIKSSLVLPSKTRLVGHGPWSVIVADPSTSFSHMLVNSNATTGNNDIRIEDLTLDGGNRTTGNNVLRIGANNNAHCDRIHIRSVEIRNQLSGPHVVLLENITASVIESCRFRNLSGAALVIMRDATDVLVAGNTFERCRKSNINLSYYNPGAGALAASPARVAIVGNSCTIDTSATNTMQEGSGISIQGGEHVSVVGNICRGGKRAGIDMDAYGAFSIKDVVVASNVIVEPGNVPVGESPGEPGGGSGVLVRAASSGAAVTRIVIKDNAVSAPRYHGVRISLLNASASISDVSVIGNQLGFDPAVSYLQQTDKGSGVACVNPAATAAGIRVIGNRVHDAPGPGIRIVGANNKRWDVQGNHVTDAGTTTGAQPGILVDGAQDVIVLGNRAQNAGTSTTENHGLRIVNPSGEALVTNNYFANNQTAGISSSGIGSAIHIFENVNGGTPQNPLS